MIIKELRLYNFGVYAGDNVFEFTGGKPVVLIGGMNGRGKTTFLEAILLALYGSNSFAYQESKFRSYGQYLKSYINISDGSNKSAVELFFSLDSNNKEQYRVRRSWNGNSQRIREEIKVCKNEEENLFLTENWSMFIENILPSRLSNFFFFDGEKIAELAVEDTDTRMKDSIRALLGISVLDVLNNDIGRIISKLGKKSAQKKNISEIEQIRSDKEKFEKEMAEIDEKIVKKNSELDQKRKELDMLRGEYKSKGGDVIKQREDLYQKKISLAAQIDQCDEMLINDAASELPLAMVKDLLSEIEGQAELEQEKRTLEMTLYQMKYMLKKYETENPEMATGAKDFINYINKNADSNDADEIYGLSDNLLFRMQRLLDKDLDFKIKETIHHCEKRIAYKEETDQIESYLSVDIDEKAIAKIYKNIKITENDITALEVELTDLEEKHRNLNGKYLIVKAEFKKIVEDYLQEAELNDDTDRLVKYSKLVIDIIEKYKIKLQSRKAHIVAETMTSCFQKLANKKNLIDKIQMDEETLDLKYINSEGNEVPKTSLSAGEKQLMVISLLWALAICSKRKLPVIIDTPLSRLDSIHRETLINTYFPNASEQTIILSTDSEITGDYYRIMKPNIGDEFILYYNEKSKATSIHKGYFGEDSLC